MKSQKIEYKKSLGPVSSGRLFFKSDIVDKKEELKMRKGKWLMYPLICMLAANPAYAELDSVEEAYEQTEIMEEESYEEEILQVPEDDMTFEVPEEVTPSPVPEMTPEAERPVEKEEIITTPIPSPSPTLGPASENPVQSEGKTEEIKIERTQEEESITEELIPQEGEHPYIPTALPSTGTFKEQLLQNYGIHVSEDFSLALDTAEQEFYAADEIAGDFKIQNWKDVLAVFMYESGEGAVLDQYCEPHLYDVLYKMNVEAIDPETLGRVEEFYTEKGVTYTEPENEVRELHMENYVREKGLNEDAVKKYSSDECLQLLSVVCDSPQTIRAYAGNQISEDRIRTVAAALSLVGKVPYFYGGKYTGTGHDPSWGIPMVVTAEGANSSGCTRDYGLDCSGFVQWSFINGVGSDLVGCGTSEQWEHTTSIDPSEALPGDLMFLAGPEKTGASNHVGIVVGKYSNGALRVVHCSSSSGGVTVSDSHSARLSYVRRSPI